MATVKNGSRKSFPGVMMSSTFRDLEQHRAVLIDALQKEDLFPIGMETQIPRTDDDVISSSLNMVEKSSAYIGLISHRYGQIPVSAAHNPHNYSITRLEFEKAQSLGLPTLIFIMHDDHPVKRADVETDPENLVKLEAFKTLAKESRIYLEFESFEHFSREAIHRIAQLRRELEAQNQEEALVQKPQKFTDPDSPIKAPALYAQPPYIGSHQFVGRRAELDRLDDWANASDPYPVLLFEAIGGSGKSMLTWEWTTQYAAKTRGDWAGMFWYSFYEKGAQMADFCRHALAYITGSPVKNFAKKKTLELSDLLLQHLRSRPWLFILDGLERVLVAYHRIDAAEIPDEEVNTPSDKIIQRDPRSAIRPEDDELIHALASAQPSKILISSRLIPKVLMNHASQPIVGVQRISLTGLRPADAEALFRSCGISGDAQDIQDYLSLHCACHPLVIGILAGLIIDYFPDRGNFNAWVADPQGGGKLNLAELDLVQKRNHILHTALANLDPACRQLLATLSLLSDGIDYPTLCAFNPHLNPDAAEDHEDQAKATAQLSQSVKDLEIRGFLQYDTQNRHYNLHPVVRGVVSGGLQTKERKQYGQKVVDHFSQKAHNPYEEVETLEELQDSLHVVRTLLKMGEFQKAVDSYSSELSRSLLLNVEAYHEILAVLKPFFPQSWSELPNRIREDDASYLMNEAGMAIRNLGQHNEALAINITRIKHELIRNNWPGLRISLVSTYVNFLNLGKLGIAERFIQYALELSKLIDSKDGLFLSLRFHFEHLSQIGKYANAEIVWEKLKDYLEMSWSRALYRLGDAEFGYCFHLLRQGKLTEKNLINAETLSLTGKNRRTIRNLLVLRGRWNMDQEMWADATNSLEEAVRMARAVGHIDASAETLLALAKFKMSKLTDHTNKANELARVQNPALLELAELWYAIGDQEEAAKHAVLAYQKYWGEGEPYVDRYFLDRSKKLMLEMGLEPPVLVPYDPKKVQKLPIEKEIVKALERLRKEKEEKEKKGEE
ncbi:DUF4062 domain-containing protein [Haliscomenobacter sp.]|uniref:DUF4062 domain-containing protein n=1 Tax=Haliscomenobacter sp. TaxID=2717303 RepID=UPI003BAA6809